MVSPNNDPGNGDDSLRALNEEIAAAVEAYNQQPDPEMGRLSPDQVFRLIHADWNSPDSPILLNENLPLDLLHASVYFRDSRTLLQALLESGGVKATAKGNLPRVLVTELMEVTGNQNLREETKSVYKAINEEDYFPLHLVRVFCEAAGLLRRVKGRFIVPKKHVNLLTDEHAGRLYRTLFTAQFRKVNLAYITHWGPEVAAVQNCIAFTLQRLGSAARDWRAPDDLYPEILLPGTKAEIERNLSDSPYTKPNSYITSLIIEPLIHWNLLDSQAEKTRFGPKPIAVKTSPLYTAFLHFRL